MELYKRIVEKNGRAFVIYGITSVCTAGLSPYFSAYVSAILCRAGVASSEASLEWIGENNSNYEESPQKIRNYEGIWGCVKENYERGYRDKGFDEFPKTLDLANLPEKDRRVLERIKKPEYDRFY